MTQNQLRTVLERYLRFCAIGIAHMEACRPDFYTEQWFSVRPCRTQESPTFILQIRLWMYTDIVRAGTNMRT